MGMVLAEKLAKNLKKRRGKMTQREFARKLGISPATLARLELAEQNTTLATLEQLCKALKCTIGALFEEE